MILIMFHLGTFDNFKHYYLHFIRIYLKRDFPDAVSYNRFVELESRVFFKMMFFLNLHSFGRCTGITFVDSTMIPVCHNLRRYANNFLMNLITALGAYCFFDNKPEAIQGYCIEDTKQLSLF